MHNKVSLDIEVGLILSIKIDSKWKKSKSGSFWNQGKHQETGAYLDVHNLLFSSEVLSLDMEARLVED